MGYIFSSDPDFEMKKNDILPVFWNFFQSIKKNKSDINIEKLKVELEELLQIPSEYVAIKQLQYFIQTSDNEKVKQLFIEKVKELSLPKKTIQPDRILSEEEIILKKILYYSNDFFSVPFRSIQHTVITIYNFIAPLSLKIDLIYFFKQLFRDVNFEKISDNYNKADIFKIEECELTITEGLEVLSKIYTNLSYFKDDVSVAIKTFPLGLSKLTAEEINILKNQLTSILGSLKLQAMGNPPGTDFYQRYESLRDELKNQPRLRDHDYQRLVANFNEVILNDLIGSFEIIITSLNEITPVKTEEVSIPNHGKEQVGKNRTKELIAEELEKIDIQGWKYSFISEEDFNTFIELLTGYFEHRNYNLSIPKIRLCKNSKTRFAKALRPIHNALSGNVLKSDLKFFEIVRVLDQFKDISNDEIYKAITR